MSRIEHNVEIDAPAALVWDVVSDLDAVTRWNPNVTGTSCGEVPYGVGTSRTCELAPAGRIDEIVSAWEPGRRIELSIGPHGGIRSAEMGFVLTSVGGATRVTAFADYHLAYGPLGPVIDRLTVRRQMQRMLAESLEGLRHHVEAVPARPHENDRGVRHGS